MYLDRQACANNIDQDQTPHNASAHEQACLSLVQLSLNMSTGGHENGQVKMF